jgi:polysaccharide export outer membrane protein
MRRSTQTWAVAVALLAFAGTPLARLGAQGLPAARPATPAPAPPPPGAALVPPADYVIGSDDVLEVAFWKDQDLTGTVTVRPDGKITLPLLNDVQAAGLTPEQLRAKLTTEATRLFAEPNVMVRVKEIKSRFVTIVGEVTREGPVPIGNSMNVVQLISLAGGFTDFAKRKNVLIIRKEGQKSVTFKFNFEQVMKGQRLEQNIDLKPGDQVIVP